MEEAHPSFTFTSSGPTLLKISLPWLAALVLAAGHHAFNGSLDATSPTGGGKAALLRVHSQAGASAIGNAFAFLAAALLGFSVGTAFVQCAWRVVRRRSFSVAGLDALWSSTHDPVAFLSYDFWKSARGVSVLAGISWAFPLIGTFAPGSLSVQTQIKPIRRPCNVPTFDFGSSALYDQSTSVKKPFLEPSSLADQVVAATLFGGQPISPTSPCAGNCSYLTSVNAPAFSCTLGFKNTSVLEWERGIVSDYPGHYANYGNVLNLSAGTNVTCISYNATYHLNYTFTGPISSVVIKQVVLDQPGSQLMLGTMADRAGPAASDPDFVDGERQTHSAWFNTTTNYYAVLSSLYSFLVGNITTDESGDSLDLVYQPPRLAVTQSRLVTFIQNVNITWGDVPTAMESLLNNITLSLLTIDPSQRAAAACVYTDSHPYFSYDAEQLWLVYGLALVVALLCDALGVFALVQIRVGPVNAEFSDFLAATRNAELDDVDVSEGSQPVRLRYGPLKDEAGRHAFSLAENIGPVGDETRGQGIRDESTVAGKGYQIEPLMYSPVEQLSDPNSPSSRACSQGRRPYTL
ncbi:hypothetical protein C8R44DRAFT_752758 [Mycena epipterygia]|nr:hypothetical protein C8R44DRAFT_752758 [Mycena epipterygia]